MDGSDAPLALARSMNSEILGFTATGRLYIRIPSVHPNPRGYRNFLVNPNALVIRIPCRGGACPARRQPRHNLRQGKEYRPCRRGASVSEGSGTCLSHVASITRLHSASYRHHLSAADVLQLHYRPQRARLGSRDRTYLTPGPVLKLDGGMRCGSRPSSKAFSWL